jgi:hypothetical protein
MISLTCLIINEFPEMPLRPIRASRNKTQEKPPPERILKLQLKFFLLGGIRPSENIRSSPLKLRIYNTISTVTHILYIPSFYGQCYALYTELENLTQMTGIIFEMIAAFLHFSIATYLLLNRKSLEHLISRTEESFVECRSRLPLGREHNLIIDDAMKKIKLYSWIFISTNIVTWFLWISVPHIFWAIHYVKNKKIEADGGDIDTKIHWEHLSYCMSIPRSGFDYPLYELVWAYQSILVTNLLVVNTAYNSTYYALTIYTSAHFKVLASLLQNIDKYIKPSDCKNNFEQSSTWLDVTNENIFENGTDFANKMTLKQSDEIEIENNKNKISQEDAYRCLDPEYTTASVPQAEDFLVNCVKYHQALLR